MNNEKNLLPKKGFKNRNLKPLPKYICIMFVVVKEDIHLCKWFPLDKNGNHKSTSPTGCIGFARTIDKETNIGFNVWEQNNDEFIYYKIIKFP